MKFLDVTEKAREKFNEAVHHPLQSYEWGEFREETGIRVIRRATEDFSTCYQMTLHKIPKFSYFIGYIPKSIFPTKEMLQDIKDQAKRFKCVYVQLEPNVKVSEIRNYKLEIRNFLRPSFHPLFTKYSFVLDLTPDEEELLKNMHPKTRYNIRVAQKHEVVIEEDNTEKGFNEFLKLYKETTNRQKFYAHTSTYHKILWKQLSSKDDKQKTTKLSYHLFHAKKGGKTLTSWVLFTFKDTLYYPYGASSRENREAMASNLIMWEAIKFGKKKGLKYFDMWGALSANPDPNDPWYGFHKFKQGYGAELTEFIGSYDLVAQPTLYEIIKVADSIRWALLNIKKKI